MTSRTKQEEGNENNVPFEISKEILELKGCLAQNESSSKRNIHKATQKMHRTKNQLILPNHFF